jgi:hypothetical protein
MGFLDWLFGKKGRQATAGPERPKPAAAEKASATTPTVPSVTEESSNTADEAKRSPLCPEAENLRKWRESGQVRSWVQARHGTWGHTDWLALLDDLRRSSFWPMDPDAVGLVLEEEKRQWGQRA